MNIKCNYGCGNDAKYQLKNKKWCCETHSNKCIAVRNKNSTGVKRLYTTGLKLPVFTSEHRVKSREVAIDRAIEKAFQNGSHYPNDILKKYMVDRLDVELKCQICNIKDWNGKELSLELDHIDGNSSNNTIENLRILCPNCHSQTSTFRGRNLNSGLKKVSNEDMINALLTCKNVKQALTKVGLTPKGANYTRAYKLLSQIK